eukprot:jgi/Pico_ML_1/51000/g2108.t1
MVAATAPARSDAPLSRSEDGRLDFFACVSIDLFKALFASSSNRADLVFFSSFSTARFCLSPSRKSIKR